MAQEEHNPPYTAQVARKSLILRAGAVLMVLLTGAIIGVLFHIHGIYSNDEVLVKAGVGLDRTFLIGLIIVLCAACLIAVTSLLKLSDKKRLEEEIKSGGKTLEQKLARVPGMLIAMTLLIGMNILISEWNRSELVWNENRQERMERKIDSLEDRIRELQYHIKQSDEP